MTKRAWWLLGLNVLIPGSAQLLAGNRKLGRFGVVASFVFILIVVVLIVLSFAAPMVLLTVGSSTLGLWAIALILAFYAVVWLVLTVNAWQLANLGRATPAGRTVVAAFSAVVLVVVAGTAGYGAYVATTANSFLSDVFISAPTKEPINGRYNILLLGGDAGADRDGLRPDSITVASIDAETGEAVLIGLPRNLELAPFVAGSPLADKYPEGYGAYGCDVDVCLLNSIYTEAELVTPELYPDAADSGSSPGIEAMRDAVEGITGLGIQYYALIEMQGFSDLVDSLGGVTINVEEAVPIHADAEFTIVAEWIQPGVQVMDGYHALWYARSRHDTTDYDRMERQRKLQQAVIEQFTPSNVLTKVQAIAAAGSKVVTTDIPQGSLPYFVNLASKTRALPIGSLELIPANDVVPEDPDFEYVRELVAAALVPTVVDDGAE
ncbi:LytR family transcriptional attenuator [Rhodoglobus vestalii]|uniref:LytR family transcriptional attenuator n=1 Tax=Rhodoglobus vestalii TaxID=193384 RepID=A0A8H2KCM9_9MICO|nr:LCP family protein [Rhodoglobus vestalii]TQO20746.1 LytR family transcriptional attenuator [Rhodoglobus vestalii]